MSRRPVTAENTRARELAEKTIREITTTNPDASEAEVRERLRQVGAAQPLITPFAVWAPAVRKAVAVWLAERRSKRRRY